MEEKRIKCIARETAATIRMMNRVGQTGAEAMVIEELILNVLKEEYEHDLRNLN